MTLSEAKKITAARLADRGLSHRLTARTVSFDDLARTRVVVVTVHGWRAGPAWSYITDGARGGGFIVEPAPASVGHE